MRLLRIALGSREGAPACFVDFYRRYGTWTAD